MELALLFFHLPNKRCKPDDSPNANLWSPLQGLECFRWATKNNSSRLASGSVRFKSQITSAFLAHKQEPAWEHCEQRTAVWGHHEHSAVSCSSNQCSWSACTDQKWPFTEKRLKTKADEIGSHVVPANSSAVPEKCLPRRRPFTLLPARWFMAARREGTRRVEVRVNLMPKIFRLI